MHPERQKSVCAHYQCRWQRIALLLFVVSTINAAVMALSSVIGLLLYLLAIPSHGFVVAPNQVGFGVVARMRGHGDYKSRHLFLSNSKWDDLVDEDEVSMDVYVYVCVGLCLCV
jgi:hypothetical protein